MRQSPTPRPAVFRGQNRLGGPVIGRGVPARMNADVEARSRALALKAYIRTVGVTSRATGSLVPKAVKYRVDPSSIARKRS